jgi:hypothetical protein
VIIECELLNRSKPSFLDSDWSHDPSDPFAVEVWKDFTILHLSDGVKTASLQFSTADIQSFLDGIPEPAYDEIIARKLNEFLETL